MSSIFENAHDDSSAASIEGSENDVSTARADENVASTNSLRSDLQTPMALARLNSHPQLPDIQPHQHSTLFYLSLIEGRCRTQAANAINAGRRPENHLPENHHEVQNLAQHLFGEMTKELHKAGVLPDEFAGRELSDLRRTYLSSFDAILNNIAARKAREFSDQNTYSSLFERPLAQAIDGELLTNSFSISNTFALQRYTMATGQTVPNFSSLSLRDTVYKNQYKELCLLGKGGFGKVYKAFHTLDGRDYAIKKVIMRRDILGGSTPQAKGEEFARELRTLARLNHPNIVRYHTSWAEHQPPELPGDSSSSSESGEESDAPETKLEFTEDMKPLPSKADKQIKDRLARESRHVRRMSRVIDESRDSIVFASLGSAAKTAGVSNRHQIRPDQKGLVKVEKSFFRSPNSPDDTDSEDSSSTDNEVDTDKEHNFDIEQTTEEVPRASEIVQSSAINFDVILFIQMSLHPMNLEDYIWPEQQKSTETPLEHCYHSLPTARILLGILDGVEYIHSCNIVHRDLKPSNIMLSVSKTAASFGSIKVSDCRDCGNKNRRELYIIPHIGDFGLVADIQDPESELLPALENETTSNDTSQNPNTSNNATSPTPITRNNPVLPSALSSRPRANTNNKLVAPPALSGLSSRLPGTRFYAAPKTLNGKSVICPKVDVYSLGVIALEMIYKFSTRSERAVELDQLKYGKFPPGFESHELSEGIKHMLCQDRNQRWGCKEVRKWLNAIIETTRDAKTSDEA